MKKKVNENTNDISSMKKFLEVSRCGRAKQRQRNVQEKCAARAKFVCLFVFFRPIVVFPPFSLPSPLSITRFYILFEQTINIIESFAFSPGLIYILAYTKPVCVSSNEWITYRLCTAIV